MKKLIFILLAVTLFATILAGCAPSARLNSSNIRTARVMVSAVDDYLDGRITASAARDIFDREIYAIDENDADSTALLSFSISASSIRHNFARAAFGDVVDADLILENRNRIAELAGLDTRRSV